MMEITLENRLLIAESLQLMIEEKENEIEAIHEKTAGDYPSKRLRINFSSNPSSLAHHKEKEIEKIRLTIKEIRKLEDTIVGGNHQILAVPNSIRLKLTVE